MYTQLRNYRVCQICTRVVPSGAATDWLVSPLRSNPDILVVRCPAHWSEWSLRISEAGRTNDNRQRMRDLADREASVHRFTYARPFPTSDRPPGM